MTDPLDVLAGLVAAILVRVTRDPIRELDAKHAGVFAHRVERRVLRLLYERYGSWNQASLQTRGSPVGSGLQRNIARHVEPDRAASRAEAETVDALFSDAHGAWRDLFDELDAEEQEKDRPARRK